MMCVTFTTMNHYVKNYFNRPNAQHVGSQIIMNDQGSSPITAISIFIKFRVRL